jgi:hypothetical protein
VRRRGAALLRWQPPLTHIVLALRQGSSTKSVETGLSLVDRALSASACNQVRLLAAPGPPACPHGGQRNSCDARDRRPSTSNR